MLASMWEFPMVLAETEEEARKGLEQLLHGKAVDFLWNYKHIFTHRIWHMKAYPVEGHRCRKENIAGLRRKNTEKFPWPAPTPDWRRLWRR